MIINTYLLYQFLYLHFQLQWLTLPEVGTNSPTWSYLCVYPQDAQEQLWLNPQKEVWEHFFESIKCHKQHVHIWHRFPQDNIQVLILKLQTNEQQVSLHDNALTNQTTTTYWGQLVCSVLLLKPHSWQLKSVA